MLNFLKRLFGGTAQPSPSSPVSEPRIKDAPLIASADPVARYEVGNRQAVLLDNITSAGHVQYLYVLVVYEQDGEPCLFVASEVNEGRQAFGGGSHFLGVFPGDEHLNLGSSDEWADRERFVERALVVARDKLHA